MKNIKLALMIILFTLGLSQAMAQSLSPMQAGNIYRLQKEQNFFRYNFKLGMIEEVVVPEGTVIQMDHIQSTQATQDTQAYWNFRILSIPGHESSVPLNIPVWVRNKKFPKHLERFQSTPDRLPPMKDLQVLTQVDKQVVNGTTTYTDTPNTEVRAEIMTTEEQAPQTKINGQFSITPGRVWNNGCTEFIDEGGNYGTWGQHLADKLDQPRFKDILKAQDLPRICPRYNDFDDESKKKFVVYLIAALTDSESSCLIQNIGAGPNGATVGLTQLHARPSGKSWLAVDHRCNKTDMFNPIANLNCTMNILDDQVNKRNVIFTSGVNTNQWAVFRKDKVDSDKVYRRIEKASACEFSYTPRVSAEPKKRTTKKRSTATNHRKRSSGKKIVKKSVTGKVATK